VEARFVSSPTLFSELSLPNTFDELFDSRSVAARSAGGAGGCSDVLVAAELEVPPALPARSSSRSDRLHADMAAAHESSKEPTNNIRFTRMRTESARGPIVP
jgi:hypothetical protein